MYRLSHANVSARGQKRWSPPFSLEIVRDMASLRTIQSIKANLDLSLYLFRYRKKRPEMSALGLFRVVLPPFAEKTGGLCRLACSLVFLLI